MLSNYYFELAGSHIAHTTIETEVIVLDLETFYFYILRDSAAEVWNVLLSGESLAEAISLISNPDEVGLKAIIPDGMTKIVDYFVSEKLLVPTNVNTQSAYWSSEIQSKQNPEIEKFTNLEELLLLNAIREATEMGWPNVKRQPG